MGELVFYLIASVLGFIVGGIIGEFQHVGWFPYAWYGLAAVWGVVIVGNGVGHCDL